MSINQPSTDDHKPNPYEAPSDDVLFHQNYQAKLVEGGSIAPTKNLFVASLVMMWLIMIGVVSGIAYLLLSVEGILQNPFDASEPNPQILPYVFIKAFVSLCWIVHIVLFCLWKRRSMRNAWIMAGNLSSKLSISPGSAVGYYFIPILMWYLPYKAMKEIWNVALPNRGSALLTVWWSAWVLYQLTAQIINALAPISGFVVVISDALFFVAGIALTRIMSAVTKAQM